MNCDRLNCHNQYGYIHDCNCNQFKQILEPIAELLQQKNKNYGDSYKKIRDSHGKLSLIIRLEDKLNRLETIAKNQNTDLGDESYEDTLKDIIGYCTLELNYLQEGQDEHKS